MEVLKYLNKLDHATPKDSLDVLTKELGVKYSVNSKYPDLYTLNYGRDDTLKFHPIIAECRSLVVEKNSEGVWVALSRSFDRFHNLGESDSGYNMKHLTAFEKMDGSLISIFFHEKYGWLYRTKAMIMPEGKIDALEVTWKEVIEDCLGDSLSRLPEVPSLTHILELTSPENRIVKPYEDRKLTLLSVRYLTGMYVPTGLLDREAEICGFNRPACYPLNSLDECVKFVSNLSGLDEGIVLVDRHGEPVLKVKSPAYVTAHHMRGEGIMTPSKVIAMLEEDDLDEYMTVFPGDNAKVLPYVDAYFRMLAEAETLWAVYRTKPSGEPFADCVRHSKASHLLFCKRYKKQSFKEAFYDMLDSCKVTMLKGFMK